MKYPIVHHTSLPSGRGTASFSTSATAKEAPPSLESSFGCPCPYGLFEEPQIEEAPVEKKNAPSSFYVQIMLIIIIIIYYTDGGALQKINDKTISDNTSKLEREKHTL